MKKLISISLLLFSFFTATLAQEGFNYEKFWNEVENGFVKNAAKLDKEYQLKKYDRWDASQETGRLVFSNKGKSKVIALFQIIGSYSNHSKTWKWAWANDTVDGYLKLDALKVKEFGEKNQLTQLSVPIFNCEDDYAWTLTSIAGQITKAKGAYRGQIPDGYVYFLITEISWAK